MSNEIDYYLLGQRNYLAWVSSPQYAQLDHDAPAKFVMKLFLPPVPQDMVQLSRPLPPSYQAWLRGFNEAKANDR